jgi:hypothetical protein
MSLLGKSIMNENCMKVVRPLFLVFIRLLDEGFQLVHFGLDV